MTAFGVTMPVYGATMTGAIEWQMLNKKHVIQFSNIIYSGNTIPTHDTPVFDIFSICYPLNVYAIDTPLFS